MQGAFAGLVFSPTLLACASAPVTKAGVWTGMQDAIVINNLGFLMNPNLPGNTVSAPVTQLDERTLRDARASGMTAVNVTIGYVAGPMSPYEYSVTQVAIWNKLIRDNAKDLIKVWSAEDIVRAKQEAKTGVIFGFQNAAMMGNNASRVDTFAGLGIKVIQLTYNRRNQLGDGSMEPENRGLTPFGEEVVERLNANNTLIDLSHSGEQTCMDAVRASIAPIAITHTGCRALSDTPRNKTDRELRLVADRGGLVGIYFMPFLKEDSFPDVMDVVLHIEHAIHVCGEDHVGIGTDGLTTEIEDMEAYHVGLKKEHEARKKAGIAAKGEKPGVTPFIPEIQGPGQFQQLADLLHRRGHSSSRIEKILGQNSLRLMETVWG